MSLLADIYVYDVVLFVHITAGVVAFGATFAYPFFQIGVERRAPRSVPAMLHAIHAASRYLVTPGLFVVLASGIYLTVDAWDFRQRFVIVGLAIIAVLIILGATFFDRQEARLIELANRDVGAGTGDAVLSAEYWQVSKRFASVGIAASLLIVVALFFMVVKP